MDLSYILEKIRNADFSEHPFRHLEINDLFKEEDFETIIKSPEIAIKAINDKDLFKELFEHNYKIIWFSGCTQNYREYMSWHKDKDISKIKKIIHTACESYGVTLRLETPKTSPVKTLLKFIHTQEFIDVITEKFSVDSNTCTYDAGLQKYLDGYEMSPHPDRRRKALTYMVNINPSPTSFDDEHHTSYLKFKPEWKFMEEFWKGNLNFDRNWVPWDWCEIQKQQRNNNSIVIFAPDNDTLHAVKADYNHLSNQRTQLYGNFWSDEYQDTRFPAWEEFVIHPDPPYPPKGSVKYLAAKYLPNQLVTALKNIKDRGIGGIRNIHGKRNY